MGLGTALISSHMNGLLLFERKINHSSITGPMPLSPPKQYELLQWTTSRSQVKSAVC